MSEPIPIFGCCRRCGDPLRASPRIIFRTSCDECFEITVTAMVQAKRALVAGGMSDDAAHAFVFARHPEASETRRATTSVSREGDLLDTEKQ